MQSGHCVAAHAKPPAFMHYFCACSTGFFDGGIEGMLMQRCRTPFRRILAAQLAWPCSSSVAHVCVSHGCLVTGRQTRVVAARAIVAAQARPYKRMGMWASGCIASCSRGWLLCMQSRLHVSQCIQMLPVWARQERSKPGIPGIPWRTPCMKRC